jgi:type II secretory pathway pseudopilin PulG
VKRTRKTRESRGGWILLDLITALIILLALMATLTAALVRQQRNERKLADTRAAMRLAEETATALQWGQVPPAPPEGESVEIVPSQPPSQPTPATPATPAGQTWVNIRVTHNGRAATLVALTPAKATTRPTGGAK